MTSAAKAFASCFGGHRARLGGCPCDLAMWSHQVWSCLGVYSNCTLHAWYRHIYIYMTGNCWGCWGGDKVYRPIFVLVQMTLTILFWLIASLVEPSKPLCCRIQRASGGLRLDGLRQIELTRAFFLHPYMYHSFIFV